MCSRIYMGDLGSGVYSDSMLGAITTTSAGNCSIDGYETYYKLTKADIQFNINANWHYDIEMDADLSQISDVDLESIALHEIGHWHGLLHVNDQSDIMYWKLTQQYQRVVTYGSMLAGLHIMEESMSDEISTELIDCYQGSYPSVTFYSDCAAVEEVMVKPNHMKVLKVYPNPSNDYINIEFENYDVLSNYIYIINSLGSEVKRVYQTGDIVRINVSDLPSGIYFINDRHNQIKESFILHP
ncbi:MAG TPA: T9SS type A sorting domain-containing protein [Flavobacteriales bacterium]|nr:T9SS type A sorting domain-containing protein [Flavobacteriales bacterium]